MALAAISDPVARAPDLWSQGGLLGQEVVNEGSVKGEKPRDKFLVLPERADRGFSKEKPVKAFDG